MNTRNAKRSDIGNVLVCDFASPGQGHKNTLVNVYAGDIIVQSMPSRFSFSLYVEFIPKTEEDYSINLKIELSENSIAEISATSIGHKAGIPVPFVVSRIDTEIKEPGKLTISARTNENKKLDLIMEKNVVPAGAE